jgi:hypothetical protein
MIQSLADRRLWEKGAEATELATRPCERVCLLLGAGASVPLLPTAAELKKAILEAVMSGQPEHELDLCELERRAGQSHITLEVFCSMLRYRCGKGFDVLGMWSDICRGVGVNTLAAAIAALRRAGWCGAILTANFDGVIQEALSGQRFRMLTELQLRSGIEPAIQPHREDVCALHGTTFEQPADSSGRGPFSPPLSATARGLARPYSPSLYRYLLALFKRRKLLVIGHSGRDYYDLNSILAELKATQPTWLESWLWISHPLGDEEEVDRLGRLVGPRNVLRADATEVLGEVCKRLGLPGWSEGGPQNSQRDRWRERLSAAIAAFKLAPGDVREFLRDLEQNLPGAWVVQEHYRLYSAGYGEGDTLTFGGVAQGGALEASKSRLPDLDFLAPPIQVPFGDLLRGQFAYRADDQRYVERQDPARKYDYSQAVALFKRTQRRIDQALRTAERTGSLRAEDRALLLVGKAIAVDYLGLIHRKRWQFLGREELRRRSIACFQRCIQLAGRARAALEPLHPSRRRAIEDLVQWRVWEQIGEENLARTLRRPKAAGAFRQAIAARQRLIQLERSRGRREETLSTMNDYLIAHYPQLWLRASELIKSLLHAEGNTAVPWRWDRIPKEHQAAVKANLRLCQDAYKRFGELTVAVHGHYPARFEAWMIVCASRGFAARTAGELAAKRQEIEAVNEAFKGIAKRFPAVSRAWVKNVRERVAAIEEEMRGPDRAALR